MYSYAKIFGIVFLFSRNHRLICSYHQQHGENRADAPLGVGSPYPVLCGQ